MTDSAEPERLAAVRQRWRAAWGDPQRRQALDTLTYREVNILVVLLTLLILVLFHFELLVPEGFPGFAVPGALVAALALLLPVQAAASVIYLALRRKAEGGIRPAWWLPIFLTACVPLFGFYLWPAWNSLVLQLPERISKIAGAPRAVHLQERRSWRERTGRVSKPLYLVLALGLIAGLLVLPLVWAFWRVSGPSLDASERKHLVALCVALHLFAAAGVVPLARDARRQRDSREWSSGFLRLLPGIVLLGLPGAGLGIIALFLSARILDERRLIPAAYQRRRDLRQGGLWLGLESAFLEQEARRAGWLRPWVRLRRTGPEPGDGQAAEWRELLYHGKAALTFPAALALSWWAFGRLAQPWADWVFRAALRGIAVPAALGCGLELILVCSHFLGKNAFSRVLVQQPYGFFLFSPESAGGLGLLAGAAIASEQARVAGGQIFFMGPTAGLVLAMLVLLRAAFRGQRSEGRIFLLWLAFGFTVMAAGFGMFRFEGLAAGLPALIALTLLLDLAWGITLVPWLIRPFRWRHLLEPALPRRIRFALAFLTATALLPLGGLFIPLWIFLRHRCWPRWEAFLWRLLEVTTYDYGVVAGRRQG